MLLFLKRILIHTLTFLFILLPLQLIGAILLLLVLPFLNPEKNLKLPCWLRWFDSWDLYSERDTSVYERVATSGWWNRYTWLAWRNPINYFHYKYLSILWDGTEKYIRYHPDENNIDDTIDGRPGLRHIEVEQHGNQYFEYYLIWVYPFKKNKCLRVRAGWKVKDKNNPPGTRCQWCLVFSPFKTFSGKIDA